MAGCGERERRAEGVVAGCGASTVEGRMSCRERVRGRVRGADEERVRGAEWLRGAERVEIGVCIAEAYAMIAL